MSRPWRYDERAADMIRECEYRAALGIGHVPTRAAGPRWWRRLCRRIYGQP